MTDATWNTAQDSFKHHIKQQISAFFLIFRPFFAPTVSGAEIISPPVTILTQLTNSNQLSAYFEPYTLTPPLKLLNWHYSAGSCYWLHPNAVARSQIAKKSKLSTQCSTSRPEHRWQPLRNLKQKLTQLMMFKWRAYRLCVRGYTLTLTTCTTLSLIEIPWFHLFVRSDARVPIRRYRICSNRTQNGSIVQEGPTAV